MENNNLHKHSLILNC